ncbi:MAG: hypothetical protein AB7R89_16165 [Dehalococcoidia bacterium]
MEIGIPTFLPVFPIWLFPVPVPTLPPPPSGGSGFPLLFPIAQALQAPGC